MKKIITQKTSKVIEFITDIFFRHSKNHIQKEGRRRKLEGEREREWDRASGRKESDTERKKKEKNAKKRAEKEKENPYSQCSTC